MSSEHVRSRPNILITGTPGTGKSITASEVASRTGMAHVSLGEIAKEKELYDGWDEQYQCSLLDEDKAG